MALEFLRSFGFQEDPFASTNAADEPLIDHYFVQPPFFPAVIGDPRKPKSNVVFAPRGGGKTAQKIMIERISKTTGGFLCIAYDRFPMEGVRSLNDISSEYHLDNITRILLLAILVELESVHQSNIDEIDKQLIIDLSRQLLGGISAARLKDQLDSIKSLGTRAAEAWEKYGGYVTGLVNAFASAYGLGTLTLPEGPKDSPEPMRFKFEALIAIARKIGFSSIYILVDRADELPQTTQDANKAFQLVSTLLTDLPLLETEGIAFKFFLWDQMKEPYQEAGGRPDRLLEYSLDWSASELDEVLQKRLETYSSGQVSRFDQLVTKGAPYDTHKMITYFANGSPRDMVRICKRILDEHTKTGKFSETIEFRTIKTALSSFALERARELYGESCAELKKIGDLTFTINTLANEVFRQSTQAVRSKVQKWQNSGAVVKVGDVPNPGNRPLYLYGIVDPRLALVVSSDSSLEEAMQYNLAICPHCENLRIGSEGNITCPDCQGTFEMADAKSLAEVCAQ